MIARLLHCLRFGASAPAINNQDMKSTDGNLNSHGETVFNNSTTVFGFLVPSDNMRKIEAIRIRGQYPPSSARGARGRARAKGQAKFWINTMGGKIQRYLGIRNSRIAQSQEEMEGIGKWRYTELGNSLG